jgi:KEOPS complex subunit Cgi121
MIELQEFNKILLIMGFKQVRLLSINDFLRRIKKEMKQNPFQVFDAKYIAGPSHLLFATINALHAFQQNRNISKNLEIETLLYASGQRQIKKAVKMLGIKKETSEIALAFTVDETEEVKKIEKDISQLVPGKRDDHVLDLDEKKGIRLIEVFDITDRELETALKRNTSLGEALVAIIIERIALLGIKN